MYTLAGDGTSMLCDMLLRVTWLHMVCEASGPRVGLFHRCIQFQGVYDLWCRLCQVVNEDQAWCILRIIRMCPPDWREPCWMNVHEPWRSYWLDEGRRCRRLNQPRVFGNLVGWLVVAVLDKIQTSG